MEESLNEIENIILTGNEGFIGKNIEKRLIQSGYNVICFEKDSTPHEISKVMTANSVLVHQGAITDTLYEDDIEMMKNNYEFSRELFDYSINKGIKVVYASSAASYGTDGYPINIYGWSKYCAEQYGIALYKRAEKTRKQFIALRYFNVFGSGEEDKGRMSSVAYQAMKKGKMKLFPKEPRRDFVYVQDIVNANIHAIESQPHEIRTGYYDVGSGEASTFEEVCKHLDIPYTYTSESEIPKGYQFFTKSSEDKWMPNWKPKYNLETALKEYKEMIGVSNEN